MHKRLLALLLTVTTFTGLLAGCVSQEPSSTPSLQNPASTTAPTESEEMVTIYVVTGQKDYVNGELFSAATFEYDDHGRPVVIGFEQADGSGRKSELSYDKQGNLVGGLYTQLSAIEGGRYSHMVDWNLTYNDDLLIRAEHAGNGYVYTFQYNDREQLVLVKFPEPEEGMGSDLWQTYAYDKDGRLIQETRCTAYVSGGIGPTVTFTYHYSQVCYFYDDQGRLQEQRFCYARSDAYVGQDDLEQLDFSLSALGPYFFYYDAEGNLAYIGKGAEDTYPGGSATIYSDEKYIFDENGNLVRVKRGRKLGHEKPSWTEYTYKAMEVSKSDASMHKRMIHGISYFTRGYTVYNTMDPLFWEMCPTDLYNHLMCSITFYYLIPYPQFDLFL